jgi:hypothetical protein
MKASPRTIAITYMYLIAVPYGGATKGVGELDAYNLYYVISCEIT